VNIYIETDRYGNTWMLDRDTGRTAGRGVYADEAAAQADLDRMMSEPMYAVVMELRDDLYGYISDASKDVCGVRMRYDISGWTTNELMEECDRWSCSVERELEWEEELKESNVQAALECGAPDRATAERWMAQA
jgi:hypothetical protein